MLDAELDSIASKEYDPRSYKPPGGQGNGRNTMNSLTEVQQSSAHRRSQEPPRLTEACTISFLQNGRNNVYNEPFNIYDPNLPFAGKKRFNPNFRPLRSKINLQQTQFSNQSDQRGAHKKTNKVTVKQSVLDEFDKVYAFNCDQQLVRTKNRNVSKDSMFDPANKAPAQHLIPQNILDKPGRIDLTQLDASKIPLAGRMGELGKLILDRKMGKWISTGPMGEE